ncbi:MAG: hypothetical protein ACLQDQ_13700 [Myxococcaceae bacterium]
MTLIHLQEDALPSALFRRLRAGVRAVGGERLRSTYQTTFWFDFGPATSVVEQAVVSLRSLLPQKRFAGVEWWLSRMKTNRIGVDFHQDRDEKLALRGGVLRHPRFSSVLFLNRVRGGALAVTAQSPDPRNPCCAPAPLDADLAAPRPNRLVWFDGALTHGVLDARNQLATGRPQRAGEMRLAVVMNWWGSRPTDVLRFPEARVYGGLLVRHQKRDRKYGRRARMG